MNFEGALFKRWTCRYVQGILLDNWDSTPMTNSGNQWKTGDLELHSTPQKGGNWHQLLSIIGWGCCRWGEGVAGGREGAGPAGHTWGRVGCIHQRKHQRKEMHMLVAASALVSTAVGDLSETDEAAYSPTVFAAVNHTRIDSVHQSSLGGKSLSEFQLIHWLVSVHIIYVEMIQNRKILPHLFNKC